MLYQRRSKRIFELFAMFAKPMINENNQEEVVQIQLHNSNLMSRVIPYIFCMMPLGVVASAYAAAPTAYPTNGTGLQGVTRNVRLAGEDDHTYLPVLIFEEVTPPEHGYTGPGKPSVYPNSTYYWSYTGDRGYTGPDSFTVRCKDEEGLYSDPVLITMTSVDAGTPPGVRDINDVQVVMNTSYDMYCDVRDSDYTNIEEQSRHYASIICEQTQVPTIVTNPLHGIASAWTNADGEACMTYTPDTDYVGPDSFYYKSKDGCFDSTNVAKVTVAVINPPDHTGQQIQVVVHELLYPEISNEVARLLVDLENGGYTTKLKTDTASITSMNKLWSYLQVEYSNTNNNLTGAILIGALPTSGNDLTLWNMGSYVTGRVNDFDIWATRFQRTDTSYGNEVDMIKRALQNNHDYRTGKSRYPHMSYFSASAFNYTGDNCSWGEPLLDIYPEYRSARKKKLFYPERNLLPGNTDGRDAFIVGGDFWFEQSHGGGGLMMSALYETTLHNYGHQVRFMMHECCYEGGSEGLINDMLYTRIGGQIFSIGCSGSVEPDTLAHFAYPSPEPAQLNRALLGAGSHWGTALLYNDLPLKGQCRKMLKFYGDLSMPVMLHPPNLRPEIDSFDTPTSYVSTDGDIEFSVVVSDPDGGATNSTIGFEYQLEFWPEGYNYGIDDPTYTHTDNDEGWTNFYHTYSTAGTYKVRMVVMDEWMAKSWIEADVNVLDWEQYLHWQLDESSGTVASDSSGNGHNGDVSNGTWGAGRCNGGLICNGTSTTVTRSMTETNLTCYTVLLWVKSASDAQAALTGIVNNNASSSDFQIDLDGAGNYRYNGSSAGTFGAAPLDTWVHLAVTCDGADTRLYYNGTQTATLAGVTDLTFGQIQAGVDRTGTYSFNGAIDEIQVYTAPASDHHITTIYEEASHLTVSFEYAAIDENGGSSLVTVKRSSGTSGDLDVDLFVDPSDQAELSTSQVTISDGTNGATFTITGIDDSELEFLHTATVTAQAIDHIDGVNTINLVDDDSGLIVTIESASISEDGGSSSATVTRVISTNEVEVTLSSSDTHEAVVPAGVIISNGQDSAVFIVNAVDDDLDDDNQIVTITATATDHDSGMDTIVVLDDEFDSCKMKITFTGYDKAETLTNFPALVILNESGTNGFQYSQFASANGWDLRFKDASETSELNYEIENWNDAESNSYVWVQVPELTDGTQIWACWGDPALAGSPAAYTTNGATWGAEYRGVWHMTETNAIDSTANGNTGTAGGSPGVSVVPGGKIGPALDFMPSAGNGYVDLPGGGTLLMGQSFTFSAWVRWDGGSSPGYAMIASKKNKYSDANGWCIETHRDNHNVKVLGSSGGGPERDVTIGSGWTDHNWTYLACVYNGANVTIYADGGPVDSGGIAAVVDRADRKLVLGNEADHGAANWNGLMDELRCAATLRSADWVWACWSNQVEASTFCTYGEVEVGGGGGADSDGDGMPDAYETTYGFNVSSNDAAGDADGDGMSNYGEYRSGTNPTNALSVLRFEAAAPGSPSEITLIWQSASGKLYSILISTDLLDTVWDVIESNVAAAPPTNTYPVNIDSDGRGYYRIKVE